MKAVFTILFSILLLSCVTTSVNEIVDKDPQVILDHDDLNNYWVFKKYTRTSLGRGTTREACAFIVYTIGSDGRVYDAKIHTSHPKGNEKFANNALRLISGAIYTPSQSNLEKIPALTGSLITLRNTRYKYSQSDVNNLRKPCSYRFENSGTVLN